MADLSSHEVESLLDDLDRAEATLNAPNRGESFGDLLDTIGDVPDLQGDRDSRKMMEEVSRLQEACRLNGEVYSDDSFPCPPKCTWKRPAELCPGSPQLFCNGFPGSEDVMQGAVGDCFFLSALSVVLNCRPDAVADLFLTEYNSEGIYAFKFFKDSEWQYVIVDDRIPSKGGKPVFGRSKNPNELWVMLIEKAYAKLYGSYEAIKGGNTSEALVDITGSAVSDIKLDTPGLQGDLRTGKFFSRLLLAQKKGSAIACGKIDTSLRGERTTQNSIFLNHAYGIVGIYTLEKEKILRVYNPWGITQGKATEKGISKKALTTLERERCAGSFFVRYEDLSTHFNRIYICSLSDTTKKEISFKGKWDGLLAGGCTNFSSWRHNPKYTVLAPKGARVTATVSQTDIRGVGELDYNQIGITVVKLKEKASPCLVPDKYDIFHKSTFWNKREVSCEMTLPPSKYPYVLVPSTFFPGQVGEFHLRLRSSSENVECSPQEWDGYKQVHVEGAWKGKSCGGPPKETTFCNNPQFMLSVGSTGKVFLFCAQQGEPPYHGAGIYILPYPGGCLRSDLDLSVCCGDAVVFTNTPEVYRELSLGPGEYLVIPCTYEPRKQRDFTLFAIAKDDTLNLQPATAGNCKAAVVSADAKLGTRTLKKAPRGRSTGSRRATASSTRERTKQQPSPARRAAAPGRRGTSGPIPRGARAARSRGSARATAPSVQAALNGGPGLMASLYGNLE